jgi:hypothetical protein
MYIHYLGHLSHLSSGFWEEIINHFKKRDPCNIIKLYDTESGTFQYFLFVWYGV